MIARVEPLTTTRRLSGPFDYRVDGDVGVGSVLRVPFGRQRLDGVVVALAETSALPEERLAKDPLYFAHPDKALFQDIRRYFPITAQAKVAWVVSEGIGAAVDFIEEQIEAGAFDGGTSRCRATTRKGKPCQRAPLPEREYCPSHQHLEARPAAA